jgi:hypothetical protein
MHKEHFKPSAVFLLPFFFFPENLQGAIKELMTTTILEPVYHSVILGKTNLK